LTPCNHWKLASRSSTAPARGYGSTRAKAAPRRGEGLLSSHATRPRPSVWALFYIGALASLYRDARAPRATSDLRVAVPANTRRRSMRSRSPSMSCALRLISVRSRDEELAWVLLASACESPWAAFVFPAGSTRDETKSHDDDNLENTPTPERTSNSTIRVRT